MTLKVSSSRKAGGPALCISRDERVFAAEPVFDAPALIGHSNGWSEIHDRCTCITVPAVDHEISNRLLEKCPETGLSSASV